MTAVGGHYTMSGARVAPSPWSLSLAATGEGQWMDQGGKGGTSGAMAATVTKNWIESLCIVKGLK